MIAICTALICAPASSNTGLSMICGKPSGLRLQMIIATCCRMIEMPIAVISGASRGAPRSGRYAMRSMVKPTAMQTGTAQSTPANTITSGGSAVPARAAITESETMAPTITTSPWAKLIS